LPIRVDATFAIDTLVWVGPPGLCHRRAGTSGLIGKPQPDEGWLHILRNLWREGASRAPMALAVELDGTVQTTVPKSKQALTVSQRRLTGRWRGVTPCW
jgi:hypothetical protein